MGKFDAVKKVISKQEGKMTTEQLINKLNEGGIHLSGMKGAVPGAESMSQRDLLRAAREAGLETYPVSGMYQGVPEGSAFIKGTDPKAREFAEGIAKKTGQDSILINDPKTGPRLYYTSGEKAGVEEPLGKGFSIGDKKPDHDYYSRFSTAEGPRYIQYGTGEVPAVHYGKPGLTELDPAFQGSGTDARKFMRTGKPETQYSSAYKFGSEPEEAVLSGSGPQRYTTNVKPEKLYDIQKDPQGFLAQAQKDLAEGNYTGNPINAEDLARTRIKEAGYEGLNRGPGASAAGSYELFKKLPLITGSAAGLLSTGNAEAGEKMDENQIKKEALKRITLDKDTYSGKTYSDTGRKSDSMFDTIDSFGMAPIRAGISTGLDKGFGAGLDAAKSQFGKDPETAPDWEAIVEKAGLKGPALSEVLPKGVNPFDNSVTMGTGNKINDVGALKKGGKFDVRPQDVVGTGLDVVLDPVNLMFPGAKAGKQMGASVKAIEKELPALKNTLKAAPEEARAMNEQLRRMSVNSPDQAQFIANKINTDPNAEKVLFGRKYTQASDSESLDSMKNAALARGVEEEATQKVTNKVDDLVSSPKEAQKTFSALESRVKLTSDHPEMVELKEAIDHLYDTKQTNTPEFRKLWNLYQRKLK